MHRADIRTRFPPGARDGGSGACHEGGRRPLDPVRLRRRKTTANPTPYSIAGYLGYDGSKKQFVQTTVDNYGSYGPSFSDGWKSDTMTFEGSSTGADGKSMAVRDYFVRKGSSGFVHFSEGRGPDGEWFKPDEETCRLATR